MNGMPYPNESAAYRAAREKLLDAELGLKRQTEKVAALRRRLPPGGRVPEDYVFEERVRGKDREVRLSELFGEADTLVVYSYMFGPKMKAPCPLCTSFLDGLEGQAHHIGQNVALAVSAKSPAARVAAFTKQRGWRRLRVVSSARSTYQSDYHGEGEDGAQWPMLNVFVKRGGEIRHFWGSELLHASDRARDGMDARHVDTMWPLWNVLDLTPGGRPNWYPKLGYPTPSAKPGRGRSRG